VCRSIRSGLLYASLVSVGCRSVAGRGAAPNTPLATQSAATPDPNRGCRTSVGQRSSDAGCWLTAEAARGPRGTLAESFGRQWVYTIEREGWRPGAGERVAVIGPLAVDPAVAYTARYMEAVFPPSYQSVALGHRHSGAEAWYVLTGAQCLETPAGPMVARAGEGTMVPAGPPMAISGVGPETRRSVLLVLHPTAELWVTSAPDWTAKGLCPK
jgi:mannose-6-phosphate isomerase-like protein (cupin superfamily)